MSELVNVSNVIQGLRDRTQSYHNAYYDEAHSEQDCSKQNKIVVDRGRKLRPQTQKIYSQKEDIADNFK